MSPKKLLWLLPLSMLAACGSSSRHEYDKAAPPAPTAASTVQADSVSLDASDKDLPLNSPERKIIHTADFHCKVRNVFAAATTLERLVKNVGGAVQESHMDNSAGETKTAYYTADSLKESTVYTTTAQLTLRIPVASLDSVINAIPGLCSFIDARTLRQSDVTSRYFGNELKNVVDANTSGADQALKLAKKSKDALAVQQFEDDRQRTRIDRKLQNMDLQDQVNYATVTVALSQPQQVYMQTVINPDHYTRTPFWVECRSALSASWNTVRSVVVVLIAIWPLYLLVIAAWFILRKMARRRLALAVK